MNCRTGESIVRGSMFEVCRIDESFNWGIDFLEFGVRGCCRTEELFNWGIEGFVGSSMFKVRGWGRIGPPPIN